MLADLDLRPQVSVLVAGFVCFCQLSVYQLIELTRHCGSGRHRRRRRRRRTVGGAAGTLIAAELTSTIGRRSGRLKVLVVACRVRLVLLERCVVEARRRRCHRTAVEAARRLMVMIVMVTGWLLGVEVERVADAGAVRFGWLGGSGDGCGAAGGGCGRNGAWLAEAVSWRGLVRRMEMILFTDNQQLHSVSIEMEKEKETTLTMPITREAPAPTPTRSPSSANAQRRRRRSSAASRPMRR